MSPTEDDLRAALRLDEPDAPSAASLIGLAQEARGARRRNVLYGAASMCAVLVVAGIAWGAHNLNTTKSASSDVASRAKMAAGGNADARSSASAADAPVAAGASANAATANAAEPLSCPAGSDVGAPSGTDPRSALIFDSGIKSMKICIYEAGHAGTGPSAALTLDATQAATQATAINAAASVVPPGTAYSCPMIRYSVIFLTSYGAGDLRRVDADSGCGLFETTTLTRRVAGDVLQSVIDGVLKSGQGTGVSNPVSGVPMSHGPGPS